VPDEAQKEAKPGAEKPEAPAEKPKEESSVTEHSSAIGGQTIPYKATAGTILLKNDKDEPTASMFYVAYTRSDVKDPSTRPVSFLYNGGPGSSTVWLHMGAFGPKRVQTVNAEPTPPAPYHLEDNPYSLLDKTDLVFIDAIGTGFSKAVGKAQNKDFWGIDEDAHAFGQFITRYVSRNNRWNSPKFLIGESYGTFRSAALGNYLQQHEDMDLNGIVLISNVLDLGTISFAPGTDLPYILYVPSYAATAYFHKALKNPPADLDKFLQDARHFASTEYADALMKGANLGDAERDAVAKKLSDFTGLSEDYLIKAKLRVNLPQFMAELQRSKGLVTGRLDSRFSGPMVDMLSEYGEYDPQETAISSAFAAAFNTYIRQELKFGEDKTYLMESNMAGGQWNWKHQGGRGYGFPGSPNVEGDLMEALVSNTHLRVQVENGYYDLATPFFETEYTMNHLGLPPNIQDHIEEKYYDAGHMMYLKNDALEKLHGNIASFIEANSGH
jgi:carboxypeptidase C (cathepsin A)